MVMSFTSKSSNVQKKHKVLVVDDHPIVRRGLVELIAMESDMEVCGQADDMAEAIKQIEANCPDVAILDISLKSGHGLELIDHIKANHPSVKMLVSSMHDELLFAERSLRAGALGYIPKQEATETLLDAIRQVLRGEIYLTARMANRLMHNIAGKPAETDPIKTLSNREVEVFEMIGQGLTTQQIAGKLKLSAKTIETHREKIKGKLDLKNSAELNRRAVQWVLENS
jgi:DNA-binding NarL/FixJ family response regulator